MSKAEINIATEGVKRKNIDINTHKGRVIINIDSKMKIIIDAYEGQGDRYAQREVSSIVIETPNNIYTGDTNTLIQRIDDIKNTENEIS